MCKNTIFNKMETLHLFFDKIYQKLYIQFHKSHKMSTKFQVNAFFDSSCEANTLAGMKILFETIWFD